MKKENIDDEKCKDCILAKLNNPKYPLCNYHQGYQEGKSHQKKEFIEMLDSLILNEKCVYCWDAMGLIEKWKKQLEKT